MELVHGKERKKMEGEGERKQKMYLRESDKKGNKHLYDRAK